LERRKIKKTSNYQISQIIYHRTGNRICHEEKEQIGPWGLIILVLCTCMHLLLQKREIKEHPPYQMERL